MKIIEHPTLDRRSPVLKCENCGKEQLLCDLHRREGSDRLSCHCGKDSITRAEAMPSDYLPNACDVPRGAAAPSNPAKELP